MFAPAATSVPEPRSSALLLSDDRLRRSLYRYCYVLLTMVGAPLQRAIFLGSVGHKTRQQMCPFPVAGLIGHDWMDFVKRRQRLTSTGCFGALLADIDRGSTR